ncbi:MAG: hypothetical protein Q7U10_05365, partial [Thermodesulfovibrionia bacterium]|nr:hypothetical protein [Thermodesulfovibrionia bacterium]
NAARAIFALNSAEYLVLFVLLIFRFPPSLIVYFTPYTTVRIPGSTSTNVQRILQMAGTGRTSETG